MFNLSALIGKMMYKMGGGKRAPILKLRTQRLGVELLEDRITPADVYWTGLGGDGVWENSLNWEREGQNAVPSIADDAYLGAGASIVNLQGAVQANKIYGANADLAIHGSMTVGSFADISHWNIDGNLTLSAGADASGNLGLSGQLHLGAGSAFFVGSTADIHGGQAVVDGDGLLWINSANLTIQDDIIIPNLDMLSSFLYGPGTLTITETLNWDNSLQGGLYSPGSILTIAASAEMNIQAFSPMNIVGWTINNAGTINWLDGDVYNTNSTLNVTAGGIFNTHAIGAWQDAASNGLSTISIQAGGVLKAVPDASNTIGVTLNMVDGGSIQGPGTLTITGTMNWDGGNLDSPGGTLNIAANGELNIESASSVGINGWTIDNAGTINWIDGDVNSTDSTLIVSPGGIFNAISNGTWLDIPENGLSCINIQADGVLNVLPGVGASTTLEVALNTDGVVNVDSGFLMLEGGGSLAGTIDLAENTQFVMAHGQFVATTLQQPQNGNQGTVVVDGNNTALNITLQNQSVILQNMDLRPGGTINGVGSLVITRRLNWSGGQIDLESTTIESQATLVVSGNVQSSGNIANYGVSGILVDGSWAMTGGTFDNYAPFEMRSGSTITTAAGATGQPLFRNLDPGSLIKRGGGVATIAVPFESTRFITIEEGELRFSAESAFLPGTEISVITGTTLRLDGGTEHSFSSGVNIYGDGTVALAEAATSLIILFGAEIAVTNLTMSGSPTTAIKGLGALYILKSFDWRRGLIRDSVSVYVAANALVTIGLDSVCTIQNNATIRNSGIIDWRGSSEFFIRNNARFINDGGAGNGVFNIHTGTFIRNENENPGSATLEVINGGTIKKIGGAITQIQPRVVNSAGIIDLNGFDIRFLRTYEPNYGTTFLNGGDLTVDGVFNQTGGMTMLQGGSLTCDSLQLVGGTLTMDSGTMFPWNGVSIGADAFLVGGGTIYGDVVNFGTVSMSHLGIMPTATLYLWGNYTQMSTGVLFVTVKGHQMGDFLSVTGTASLAGTLMVYLDGSFENGDLCDILEYSGLVGEFGEIVGASNNLNWSLNYGDQVTSLHL